MGGHLNKLLASQFPVGLCPFDLSGIPLHLEILVAFASTEFEYLHQWQAIRHKGFHHRSAPYGKLPDNPEQREGLKN